MTGIKKIDAKLDGGFPKNKGFLVTGAAGSGKTIFGLHFIREACKEGKKCIFIATEETTEDILAQAKMLGFDLNPYVENKQLSVIRILEIRARNVASAAKMLDDLAINEIELLDMVNLIPDGTEVVVIDNIGVFALDMSVKEFRNEFDTLNHILSKLGCTTLFVMDKSKIEAGKMKLKYTKFSVSTVIDEVINLVSPMSSDKDIVIEATIDKQISFVNADIQKIKHILLNLLDNAIKFTPNGGSVKIDVSHDGYMLKVAISDTGIGISKNDQDKLFHPFVQLDASTTRKYRGTGLGLALVKQMIELHGGKIWIESEFNEGSTFIFTLPFNAIIKN